MPSYLHRSLTASWKSKLEWAPLTGGYAEASGYINSSDSEENLCSSSYSSRDGVASGVGASRIALRWVEVSSPGFSMGRSGSPIRGARSCSSSS